MTLPPGGGLIGQVLDGRYRIDRLLGQGGMAEVYLAHHLGLDRPCALKVVHASRRADPEATARFAREAEAASRITHPNLCRTYDFGETADGIWYLAMEYIAGQPLGAVLAAGPLGVDRTVHIVSQCAAGLQAVHDAGLIHRDLKPDNVMLTPRAEGEVAVLVDFGIAREPEGHGLTRDGLMVGTPEMMSPEQIAGDPVDSRSDQYQLGLLAYRLLTGAFPFPGATTQERMTRRLTQAPQPLRDSRPDLELPPGIDVVLQRALHRQPGARFPTVRAFATALSAAARGSGEETEHLPRRAGGGVASVAPEEPTVTVSPRTRPWATWPRLGLLALAVVLVGIWYVTLGAPPATPPSPPPPTAPESLVSAPPSAAPAAQPPPPPPPASLPATPTLPAEDAVYSPDPVVREAARQQAIAVYRTTTLPDTLRAVAAFLVAATYLSDRLGATARVWLEHCLALQERAMCRQLLSTIP